METAATKRRILFATLGMSNAPFFWGCSSPYLRENAAGFTCVSTEARPRVQEVRKESHASTAPTIAPRQANRGGLGAHRPRV
jgi:hypothetical protein